MSDKSAELHKDHRQRMRKKFLENPASVFEDHELLEILLFFSIPRANTNETAHRLIRQFGSFANVFDAPYHKLTEVDGVGASSAFLIRLISAVSARYLQSRNGENPKITTREEAARFLQPYFLGKDHEALYALMLDGSRRVIQTVLINEGNNNQVSVNAHYLMNKATACGAKSFLIAHSHPGGFASPSSEDVMTTLFMLDFFRESKIPMLDHLIFSNKAVFYFSAYDNPEITKQLGFAKQ